MGGHQVPQSRPEPMGLEDGWYVIEIVSRLTGDRRFKLLPWRWVVERTFGWLGRCRIHSKDYEHLTDSSEAGSG